MLENLFKRFKIHGWKLLLSIVVSFEENSICLKPLYANQICLQYANLIWFDLILLDVGAKIASIFFSSKEPCQQEL